MKIITVMLLLSILLQFQHGGPQRPSGMTPKEGIGREGESSFQPAGKICNDQKLRHRRGQVGVPE